MYFSMAPMIPLLNPPRGREPPAEPEPAPAPPFFSLPPWGPLGFAAPSDDDALGGLPSGLLFSVPAEGGWTGKGAPAEEGEVAHPRSVT